MSEEAARRKKREAASEEDKDKFNKDKNFNSMRKTLTEKLAGMQQTGRVAVLVSLQLSG